MQSPEPGIRVAAGRAVTVNVNEVPKSLAGYKVAIFHYDGEPQGKQLAMRIEAHLKASGVNGVIEIRASSEQTMQLVYPPKTVEIRYESGPEDAAADALLTMVQQVEGVGNVRRLPVTTPTPMYLSIFIPSSKIIN